MLVAKNEVAARIIVPIVVAVLGIAAPAEYSELPKPAPASKKAEKKAKKVSSYTAPVPARARREPQAGPELETMVAAPAPLAPLAPLLEEGVARPSEGSVFSSIAFQIGGIPGKARWSTVSTAGIDTGCGTACPAGTSIGSAIEAAKGKPVTQQLVAINSAVNRAIAYTKDQDVWGKRDYWAKPQETIAKGKGDCEDYAILKMAALKEAGVPASSMTLVVLRDQRRNLFHAVLAVMTDRGQYILDNLRMDVPRDTALGDYQALYSMSESRTFIHGYATGASRMVGKAPALGAAQPGEGPDEKS
jgi:predicted transglutaminase-like cysteine proteinase